MTESDKLPSGRTRIENLEMRGILPATTLTLT
jgi:hypothetical protein